MIVSDARGSSMLELLCSIALIAALSMLAWSVLLTTSRRARELHDLDLARRRSERIFGIIADAVRSQREAPGLPLWRVLDDSTALTPWPASIPREGARSPLNRAMLAFARVDAGLQWRIIREPAAPSLALSSLPLCMQPLFQSDLRLPPSHEFFLGVAADRVLLLHGKIAFQRVRSARCRGRSAGASLESSGLPWPFVLQGSERVAADQIAADEIIALRPVEDGFVLYLDHNRTVRRAALLNRENQPVATEVDALKISVTALPGIAEVELGVELTWRRDAARAVSSERWILPVVSMGEQLLGIH